MSTAEVGGVDLVSSTSDDVETGEDNPGSSITMCLEEPPSNKLFKVHDDTSKDSIRKRMHIFILLSLLECFVNYDIGAMAIMIDCIQVPYDFSTTDLGILGALPYLGLILLSPLIGGIFTYFKARWLIAVGLALNLLSLVFFALAQNKIMFYASRFLVGATQSFFIIYAPVWVGCFAPETNKNMWMAILQGSIAVGFMIGYTSTALFRNVGDNGWRYSLVTQSTILTMLIYCFIMVPSEYINLPCTTTTTTSETKPVISSVSSIQQIRKESKSEQCVEEDCIRTHGESQEEGLTARLSMAQSDCTHLMCTPRDSCIGSIHTEISVLPNLAMNACYYDWCRNSNSIILEPTSEAKDTDVKMTICQSFWTVIKNPYFCFSTVAVSVLFYILTAIQFWTTKVTVTIFDVPHTLIYTLFIVTSTTAPVTGVTIGSCIIDRLNAKYPGHPIIIDSVIMSWAVIALLFGISALVWQNLYNMVFCIWVILFFGGCMLPPLTLITISTVPQRLQPMASSICMCLYHIFGYIGGTVIPGITIDITKADSSALYATYLPAALGTLAAFGNVVARYRERKHLHNAVGTTTV